MSFFALTDFFFLGGIIMAILYCALYIAAIGIASHYIGNALPRRWFRADAFPYRSFAWEQEGKIYRRIGVQHWKEKLPDMSKICGDMVRKEIACRPTAESMERLVAESCVAECVHFCLILLSLPVLAICPGAGGWVVFGLCFLGNFPFMLIQRYNRPRLVKALSRLRRKA